MDEVNAVNEASVTNECFQFTGKAGEFFAIWIVNIALTILTLGIYSAWAKVRTNQYFYGNTFLADASFRYTANPVQILKGRIIAFVVFMAYSISTSMDPVIAGGALILLMILTPAFLVMSMAFRLRNSMYRNVRFNFDKNFKRAYFIFALPVVVIGLYIFITSQIQNFVAEDPESMATFGIALGILLLAMVLMFPWWDYMVTNFKVVHARFGTSDFKFTATTKNYYRMYFIAFVLSILIFGFAGIIVAGVIELLKSGEETGDFPVIMPFLIIFIMLPAYLWLFAYMQAKRTNLMYNNLDISGNKVQSELKTGYLLYLYITNTLAMMISLGLLMPWAKVRTARYRASVTSLNVAGDLGQYTSAQQQQQSALGEEIGEMFDMDLGF
ncbi:MAG: YjgN family protein [Gammaproteobacteria bacterium]|nr:YjgN family protein [Gammaproteobacteria bacterium]